MASQFQCPTCQSTISSPDPVAGLPPTCPRCGKPLAPLAVTELPHGTIVLTSFGVQLAPLPNDFVRVLPIKPDVPVCLTCKHRYNPNFHWYIEAWRGSEDQLGKMLQKARQPAMQDGYVVSSQVKQLGGTPLHEFIHRGNKGFQLLKILGVFPSRQGVFQLTALSVDEEAEANFAACREIIGGVRPLPPQYRIAPRPGSVPLLTRTGCRTVSSKAGDYTLRIPSAAWQLLPPAGDQDFAAEAATHDAKITIFRVNRSDTVDVNYLLTTSPIRFGDEGDTVMTSQVEDTQFSGHYAVICTYVIRRSSDPPVTKELGVVAMNGTVFYLDSTVMPGGLQAVADMVVRSFRQGTAAERGEQDFVPEPASAAAKIAEEDESKSSNLQDTLEGVGGIGLCVAGLATAVYLLAILCRLFGATWWPATGGLVSMAWWGSVGFVAVIGLVSGWIWPHYYKPKQFAAFAHVGAYQKQRWQAWFLAVLAAAALTLRLTLGVSWFFVPLAIGALVLAGIVLVKGGGAAFKTSKLIRSAGAIPERFLKSARDPAQIEQASEALGSGLLPATTVEGCQATEELLKAHAQEKAHRNIATCVVCGGYDRGIEKLDTCVLCHKPVCPACRAEATGGVIVCRTCHTFGAVCCSCGVYFRKRLSLASCRACYQHVCEQCAKRYTVEETYDPQELDPSWREIYRPYVVKEGRQQDWIPLCPACDPQKRQLFGDTSLGQAMRRKVADIAYAVHEKALADAIRAQAWQPKQAAAGGRGK